MNIEAIFLLGNSEVKVNSLSRVRLFVTPWSVTYQAPLSIEFSTRILEWVAISFSRDLPDPGIEPGSPALQADPLTSEPPGETAVVVYPMLVFVCFSSCYKLLRVET